MPISLPYYPLTNTGCNDANKINANFDALLDQCNLISVHANLSGLTADDHQQYLLVDGTRALTGNLSMGSNNLTNLAAGADAADAVTKAQLDAVAMGAVWLEAVIDIQNDPPVGPTTGDRYIVGTSPSGDWVGHGKDVTEYNGATWDFTTPSTGNAVWVDNLSSGYNYNGSSWVQMTGQYSHSALSNLSANDHTQYVNAISDTSSINLTLTGQSISGEVLPAGIEHSALAGLNTTNYTHLTDANHTTLTTAIIADSLHHHSGLWESDNGAQAVFVDAVGRVGVGGAPNHFFTASAADGVGDDIAAGAFYNAEATAGRNYGLLVVGGSNSSDYSFASYDKDSTQLFKVRGDGHTVVGNTTPVNFFTCYAPDGVGDDICVGIFTNLEATAGRNYGVQIKGGSNNSDFNLNCIDVSNNSLLKILGNGCIGVGLSDPKGKFTVDSPYSDTPGSRGGITLRSGGSGGSDWWSFGLSNAGDLTLDNVRNVGSESNALVILTSTNYVGLGIASPTAPIQAHSTDRSTTQSVLDVAKISRYSTYGNALLFELDPVGNDSGSFIPSKIAQLSAQWETGLAASTHYGVFSINTREDEGTETMSQRMRLSAHHGYNSALIGGRFGFIESLTTGGSAPNYMGYNLTTSEETGALVRAKQDVAVLLKVIDGEDGLYFMHAASSTAGSAISDPTLSMILSSSNVACILPTQFGTSGQMTIDADDTNGTITMSSPLDLVIDCDTEKTVVLTQPVYNDANVGALVLQTGGTLPGVVEIISSDGNPTEIYTRGFAVGEQGSGAIEIPHDYKEGTNLTFHIHWGVNDAPSGTDYVKWSLTFTVLRDDTTFFPATVQEVETAIDTQYEWVRSSFASIPGGGFKIGDQFMFSIKRIAAGGAAFAGEALVATIGFHYQCDTLGSRTMYAK